MPHGRDIQSCSYGAWEWIPGKLRGGWNKESLFLPLNLTYARCSPKSTMQGSKLNAWPTAGGGRVCRWGAEVRWLAGTHPGISGEEAFLALCSKESSEPPWVCQQPVHLRRTLPLDGVLISSCQEDTGKGMGRPALPPSHLWWQAAPFISQLLP